MLRLTGTIIIIFTGLILIKTDLIAQSLQPVVNDSKAFGLESDSQIELKANVRNISSTVKSVKIRLEMKDLTVGHKIAFCFGSICYPPVTSDFEMPNGEAFAIPPDRILENGLNLDLIPNGIKGISKIKVVFMVAGLQSDSVSFVAEFYAGMTAVNESVTSSFAIYPNPTSSFLIIKLNSSGGLMFDLFDLKGNYIKSQYLNEGINVFYVNDLLSGEYFYTLRSNTKQLQDGRCLIISH